MFASILDKSPWGSTAIFIFFCHFSVPLKRVRPSRNFLVVLPLPTLYKVETRKKFGIHASNIVCGMRGGVDLCELKNAPRKASVPRLLSMIVVYETMGKRLFDKYIRASCPRPGTGQNLASRTSFLSLYVKAYSKNQRLCYLFVALLS